MMAKIKIGADELILWLRKNGKVNAAAWIMACILVVILFATLPFHYIIVDEVHHDNEDFGADFVIKYAGLKIVPKEHLSFSNTFVFQEDIDKIIERYNNASFIGKQAISQEPLHRKLMENGFIVEKRENETNFPENSSHNPMPISTQAFDDRSEEDYEYDPDFFSENTAIADNISYNTYYNARFHFSIDYPSYFVMERAPTNGDGRRFSGKNATLTAGAGWSFRDIKEEFKQSKESQYSSVTYERIKDNWFVLSGFEENGNIYYSKTICKKDDEGNSVTVTATLTFDSPKKEYYEKVINHIFKTLN